MSIHRSDGKFEIERYSLEQLGSGGEFKLDPSCQAPLVVIRDR